MGDAQLSIQQTEQLESWKLNMSYFPVGGMWTLLHIIEVYHCAENRSIHHHQVCSAEFGHAIRRNHEETIKPRAALQYCSSQRATNANKCSAAPLHFDINQLPRASMDMKQCACVYVSVCVRKIFGGLGINRTRLAGSCKHWIINYGG